MTDPLGLIVVAAVAAVAGWMAGRLPQRSRLRAGAGPHLLPDPALDWLRRAHQAIGVWITELDPSEEGPRAERILDAERLSVAQIVAVDRRLERARDQEQSGAERMDSGTFVFHAEGGAAVGLLLPVQLEATKLGGVEDDLRRLLDVGLLVQHGRARSTRYVASEDLRTQVAAELSAHAD